MKIVWVSEFGASGDDGTVREANGNPGDTADGSDRLRIAGECGR